MLHRFIVALDLALAALVGLVGLGSFFARAAAARRRGGASASCDRRILYLGSGNMDQVGPRNGVNLFLKGESSDFDGFFSRVYNVSFPAGQRKVWHLTERHTLIDYDLPAAVAVRGLGLRALSVALREVAFLHWALRFALRQQVSVIEATNPYLQGLNAYLLARACRLPYAILITRDYDFDYRTIGKLAFPTVFPTRRREKLVERWVLGHADLVLADRGYYLRYALANGAPPARCRQTRVVVDEAYYTDPASRPPVREALGLARGKLLLHLGRLQADKLPGDVVRCLALVRARGLEAELAFAGDGELRPELERLAEELGVRPYVYFLGAQSLEVLPSLMSSAEAIVCAHMGYTLLEAALSGRPIVTYEYEWHPEIIEHGRTGVLVPFRDVGAMADWVVRLLSEPQLADRLGQAARAFVLERHQRAPVMADYQRFFRTVLQPASREC
ncbi:MAG: glycosyltransferase [Chloroflexi bacterium]|nr:glycosyltransferase [Chloroflexota bacterium]